MSDATPSTVDAPADGSVILLRSGDALRIRQIAALLETEGIMCATPGLEHRSMVGPYGAFVDIILRVSAADAERARGLIQALDEGVPVQDAPEASSREPNPRPSYRKTAFRSDDDYTTPSGDIRLRRIAVLGAFIFPGGAHLYVHAYRDAFVIMALYALALYAGISLVPWTGLPLVMILGLDIGGALQRAELSQGRDVARSLRRFSAPSGVVLVPAVLLLLAGPVAERLAGAPGRAYCTAVDGCGGDYGRCVRLVAQAESAHAASARAGSTQTAAAQAASEAPEVITPECLTCMQHSDCADIADCDDHCVW